MTQLTAEGFIAALNLHQSDEERQKTLRYFKSGKGEYGEGDQFIGVRMGKVFETAKAFIDLPLAEIEKVLDSPIHEHRAGALSIMNQQGRRNKTPEAQRKALYELYLRRHDRINNWDLVDLACIYVVGRYLADKPRDILVTLARSDNLWERRSAITATAYFIRNGQIDDTLAIAEMLLDDPEDLIHKATGGWLRFAGDVDRNRLKAFLDRHAAHMPRTMLRYALEHFDKAEREYYMKLKDQPGR